MYDIVQNLLGLIPQFDNYMDFMVGLMILVICGWLIIFVIYEIFNFFYLLGRKIFL